MHWRRAGAAVLLAAATACSAQADPQADFTTDLAARFKAAYPDLPVAIAAPLTLSLGDKDNGMTANLDRIYNVCQTNSAEVCADTKTQFVAAIAEQLAAAKEPALMAPRRENLRLLLRDAGYCRQIEPMMQSGKAPSSPVTAPFTADTCVVMMFDFPSSRRVTSSAELETLGLTRDAAWQIAKAQVLAPLPKLAAIDLKEDNLNLFADMPDSTSLVLDSAGWAALAAKHPGKQIIIGMPDDGFLTVLITGPDYDAAGLRQATRETFESAQRGISPRLLRWSPAGWQPLP
jgi:hypothetical protein